MDPLLWWTILLCLIVLITVLSLYLCYGVFTDNFRPNNSSTTPSNAIKLNKYKFERTDVEDLTRIQKNYQHFNPKISFVNEVQGELSHRLVRSRSQPSSPRAARQRKGSLLPDIHESSDCFRSVYSVNDIMSEVNSEKGERRNSEMLPRRFSLVTEGMRKNSLAALPRKFSLKPDSLNDGSTDTLDCLDPLTVETKRDIAHVEEDVCKIDYEIDYFLGQSKNLKYYEINERLIRLNLALSDLQCADEELRKRKKEVQVYINKCKEKLNSKVV